jgi:hypothetical protein
MPVLGVCFGGQLPDQAHGGSRRRSDRPEIGWYTIESDDRGLMPEGPWFQWQYDGWTNPPVARDRKKEQRGSSLRPAPLAGCAVPPRVGQSPSTGLTTLHPDPRLGGAPLDIARLGHHAKTEQDTAAQRVSGFLTYAHPSDLRAPQR